MKNELRNARAGSEVLASPSAGSKKSLRNIKSMAGSETRPVTLPLFVSFRFMHKVSETQLVQYESILSDGMVAADLLRVFDSGKLFFSDEVLKLFTFFNMGHALSISSIESFMRSSPIASQLSPGLKYRIYQTRLITPAQVPEQQKIIAHVMVLITSPPPMISQ